jgi:hypothetical protein
VEEKIARHQEEPMKIGRTALIVTALVTLVAAAGPATADILAANFSGYADHSGGVPGVYSVGETYVARMILNTVQDDPWYPWLPAQEYTAVLSTTVTAYFDFGTHQQVVFADAAVEIWQDNTTAADYANPATFTDGTLLLSGTANAMMGERPAGAIWPYAVSGDITFTGGAGLGVLHGYCDDGVRMNDYIDFVLATPPAGYEEKYDAEWKCGSPVTVDESTWGEVKSRYR